MPSLNSALDILTRPVTRLFDLGDSLSIAWLMSALVFTLGFVVILRARRHRGLQLRAFMRFALPKRVLLHPSSVLDYKLFATNTILMASVLGFFILGAPQWQSWTFDLLTNLFGPPTQAAEPAWSICALTLVLQVVSLDLGYWLAHLWFHESPMMWEFHKVHHSAEVMTPATEWRQHPVELVTFPIVYGMTTGITYAVVSYVFGPEAQQFGIAAQTWLIAAHLATFHHLRHSHVQMPFTGLWGRLLHSPAHHHIHHSADAVHHGKNLGYMLSIWDWMSGRLHIPTAGERLTLGIGDEGKSHTTVRHVMLEPIRRFWRLARPSSGRSAA